MGRIAKLADLPTKERRRHPSRIEWLNGKSLPIRDVGAVVTRLRGYSAHADQVDLLTWTFLGRQDGDGIVAPTLFVQHGDDRQREALRAANLVRAYETNQQIDVVLPKPGEDWILLEAEPTPLTA